MRLNVGQGGAFEKKYPAGKGNWSLKRKVRCVLRTCFVQVFAHGVDTCEYVRLGGIVLTDNST